VKKWGIAALVLLPVLFWAGCGLPSTSATSAIPTSTKPKTMPVYDISEALAQGLVTMEASGFVGTAFLGASSGDVIKLSFQRQKPETIKIIVPPGTVLINSDARHQDMVIMRLKGQNPGIMGYYPIHEVVLYGDDRQDYLFEAYCQDMEKDNIHENNSFTLGTPAAADVVAVLNAAAGMELGETAFQSTQVALWALTDDPTRAEIDKRFKTDDAGLAGAWAILEQAGQDPAGRKLFAGYTAPPTPASTSPAG